MLVFLDEVLTLPHGQTALPPPQVWIAPNKEHLLRRDVGYKNAVWITPNKEHLLGRDVGYKNAGDGEYNTTLPFKSLMQFVAR
jgi:hypothetical protein